MGKNVLFVLAGTKTWVISQALYAFEVEKHIHIDRLVIATTKVGKKVIEEGDEEGSQAPMWTNKAGPEEVFTQLRRDYNIELKEKTISLLEDDKGSALTDARTPEECKAAAYSILRVILRLRTSGSDQVYCVFAGGRRLMVAYLMSALSLAGSKNYHLYYVLVHPEEASHCRTFYYKPRTADTLHLPSGDISTNHVKIDIAEIPFLRLGEKYASVVDRAGNYDQVVSHLQEYLSLESKPVESDPDVRRVAPKLVGTNQEFLNTLHELDMYARAGTKHVLLLGETGTGKELFARRFAHEYLNYHGKNGEFVKVNCAAIPETLMDSELFGHVKGAFTGADTEKKGYIENANNGVLFLDEIGKAPLAVQIKLLRFLSEGEIQPVGGGGLTRKVDVRTVFAMREDVNELFFQGRLIEDFYSRIKTPKLVIPPLRRRKDDIPILTAHFLALKCEEQKKAIPVLPKDLTEFLTEYSWPHNLRELEEALQTMVALNDNTEISQELSKRTKEELCETDRLLRQALSVRLDPETVCRWLGSDEGNVRTLDELVGEFESRIVEAVLRKNDDNLAKTARELGIDRETLRGRIKRHKKTIDSPPEDSA